MLRQSLCAGLCPRTGNDKLHIDTLSRVWENDRLKSYREEETEQSLWCEKQLLRTEHFCGVVPPLVESSVRSTPLPLGSEYSVRQAEGQLGLVARAWGSEASCHIVFLE